MKKIAFLFSLLFFTSCYVVVEEDPGPPVHQGDQIEIYRKIAHYDSNGHCDGTSYTGETKWVYEGEYILDDYPQNHPCGCETKIWFWGSH